MKVTKPPKVEEILIEHAWDTVLNFVEQFLPDTKQQSLPLKDTNISADNSEIEIETSTLIPNEQSKKIELRIPEKQTWNDLKKLYTECYDLITTHKTTDEKGRYLYWDKIKHKYGKQAEMVWAATKINRLAGKKKITDFQNHEFSFCVPDTMQ